ncbi:hypothetical protein CKF59_02185 [Psittacicella gerlachiana]|uniref:site-specific DNA-methyltransferase (adenine-specific) n=1 Tax=Psittacicella gerlachiana TaxID=2028574 RepID=A0A3A1YFA9_9GAMM|nr:hypothetical protein CKF59_02185 [Psittacicella gerlachiana]
MDNNTRLIELLQFLQTQSYEDLIKEIESKIIDYGFSDTHTHGYEYYHCQSSNGVGSYNKKAFQCLKQDYNQHPEPLLFLLLIIFGFNNQIRFNRKGEFNIPVGKRDFNASLRRKLQLFCHRLKNKNPVLCSKCTKTIP